MRSDLFVFFPFELSSLLLFLLSGDSKVKGCSSTIVKKSQLIFASSQFHISSITAGHEGKPSGKRVFSINKKPAFILLL